MDKVHVLLVGQSQVRAACHFPERKDRGISIEGCFEALEAFYAASKRPSYMYGAEPFTKKRNHRYEFVSRSGIVFVANYGSCSFDGRLHTLRRTRKTSHQIVLLCDTKHVHDLCCGATARTTNTSTTLSRYIYLRPTGHTPSQLDLNLSHGPLDELIFDFPIGRPPVMLISSHSSSPSVEIASGLPPLAAV